MNYIENMIVITWWFAKECKSSCCLSSCSKLWLRLKNFVKLSVFVVAVNSFSNAFGKNDGFDRWTPPWEGKNIR